MTEPTTSALLGGALATTGLFLLEIDNVEIGYFQEVHGLEVTVGVEEIKEGGQNQFSRKLPGRMTWPNITFKRGLTQADALFSWLQQSAGDGFAANSNTLTRTTGAITALARPGSTTSTSAAIRLRSWNLIDVFPVRWKGPDFAVSTMDPLSEELEIAHHGFSSSDPGGSAA